MGREKGGGAEFSGFPISPQVDAGELPDSLIQDFR